MHKIQSLKAQPYISKYLVFFVIVILSFLLLSSKTSSSLLSPIRQESWAEYYKKIEADGINPRTFWEFREFFSNGSLQFSPSGLTRNQSQKAIETLRVMYTPHQQDVPVLLFTSAKIVSIDILTRADKLNEIIGIPSDVLRYTNNELLYRDGKDIIIIFLKTVSDLKQVNGYFDYNGTDKGILEEKHAQLCQTPALLDPPREGY